MVDEYAVKPQFVFVHKYIRIPRPIHLGLVTLLAILVATFLPLY